MVERVKAPLGAGLVLTGSGIYWSLSGTLIASFSVLAPGLFQTAGLGRTFVLCTGVVSAATGLWIISPDLQSLSVLLRGRQGWLFSIPFVLVASDLFLTVAGMSWRTTLLELNPFVERTLQLGPAGVLCYAVSYSMLSVGIALMMNHMGKALSAVSDSWRPLPYSMVCGAGSFGTISNTYLILGLGPIWTVYLVGSGGAVFFSGAFYYLLRRSTGLTG